jgi:hypothetical protein
VGEGEDPDGRGNGRQKKGLKGRVRVVVARPKRHRDSDEEVARRDAVVVPPVGRREAPGQPGEPERERRGEENAER